MRKLLKLRNVGTSTVVTVPKEVMTAMGWQPGDEVCMEAAPGEAKYITVEMERQLSERSDDEVAG